MGNLVTISSQSRVVLQLWSILLESFHDGKTDSSIWLEVAVILKGHNLLLIDYWENEQAQPLSLQKRSTIVTECIRHSPILQGSQVEPTVSLSWGGIKGIPWGWGRFAGQIISEEICTEKEQCKSVRQSSSSLKLSTDQVWGNYWRPGKAPSKTIKSKKSSGFTQGWEECLFLPTTVENLITHKESGRVFRGVLLQQWDQISPKLKAILILPNKTLKT